MTIRGQIIAEMDGEPLENASVQIVNRSGVYLGQGVKTDSAGKFALTSDMLTGNYILISYAGLEPLMVESTLLKNTTYKVLIMGAELLDPVTVTPKKANVFWWLVGIVTVVGIVSSKKKKKSIYG